MSSNKMYFPDYVVCLCFPFHPKLKAQLIFESNEAEVKLNKDTYSSLILTNNEMPMK